MDAKRNRPFDYRKIHPSVKQYDHQTLRRGFFYRVFTNFWYRVKNITTKM